MAKPNPSTTTTLHFGRGIAAPVREVTRLFRSTRALARWWDPTASLSRFRVGGTVTAAFLPSFEIIAIVPDRLIAHRYTSVIDGVGLWSFVAETRNTTRVVFDHNAAGNAADEPGRTFYWRGLLENLGAVAEGRPVPFVNGAYIGSPLPRGVRARTMDEFLRAWRRSA